MKKLNSFTDEERQSEINELSKGEKGGQLVFSISDESQLKAGESYPVTAIGLEKNEIKSNTSKYDGFTARKIAGLVMVDGKPVNLSLGCIQKDILIAAINGHNSFQVTISEKDGWNRASWRKLASVGNSTPELQGAEADAAE